MWLLFFHLLYVSQNTNDFVSTEIRDYVWLVIHCEFLIHCFTKHNALLSQCDPHCFIQLC